MTTKPTLTVHDSAAAETPSEVLTKGAAPETVTDERGRVLTVRNPDVLAQFRLMEALGDLSSNTAYMQTVNPLLYLAAIDGDPVFLPMSKAEVEALLLRLDHHGLAALFSWYMANVMKPTEDAVRAAEREARERAAVKN